MRYILFGIVLTGAFVMHARAAILDAFVTVSVLPNAPSGLVASPNGDTEVSLAWTDNATNEDGFQVERALGTSGVYAQIATTSQNIAVYLDDGLSPNTVYTYRIQAFNADGGSGYSNEASSTTTLSTSPGSVSVGSSSGGGGSPVVSTEVVFQGLAYPQARVTLLRDAQVIATTTAGNDAAFTIRLTTVTPGGYMFGVWAEDRAGGRATTYAFPVSVAYGATTVVSGVFISPTIVLDKREVRRGDPIIVSGSTVPGATIFMVIDTDPNAVATAIADAQGTWIYRLDTSVLDYGDHVVQTKAEYADDSTTFSSVYSFKVGTVNRAALLVSARKRKEDLNDDNKVNLVDYSILAYWYKRPNPPENVDLNGDGVITLVDFSIVAYYWTG